MATVDSMSIQQLLVRVGVYTSSTAVDGVSMVARLSPNQSANVPNGDVVLYTITFEQ